jgi:hypothetical protein
MCRGLTDALQIQMLTATAMLLDNTRRDIVKDIISNLNDSGRNVNGIV